MDIILFKLTLFLYITATAGFLLFIIKRNKWLGLWSQRVLFGGFLIHSLYLVLCYYKLGAIPALNIKASLSFYAWAIIAAYITFHIKFKITVLGSFIVPFTAFLMIISSTIPISAVKVVPMFKGFWFPVHVVTAFLGDAIFAVACMAGIMYLIQERQIKSKRPGPFFARLPSLNILDSLNYHAITYGFFLLTIGMITGSILAQGSHGSYWLWDPKEVWSLITWLCYAALLHQRLAVGWRGRRSAIMSIGCFLVLIFTFVGVNFLMEGYHSFESIRGQKLP